MTNANGSSQDNLNIGAKLLFLPHIDINASNMNSGLMEINIKNEGKQSMTYYVIFKFYFYLFFHFHTFGTKYFFLI